MIGKEKFEIQIFNKNDGVMLVPFEKMWAGESTRSKCTYFYNRHHLFNVKVFKRHAKMNRRMKPKTFKNVGGSLRIKFYAGGSAEVVLFENGK